VLATFEALAEPNRLHILELLREKPHSVNDLVAQLKVRQPQVSKHLHVLMNAGLVEVRPDAQRRIYELRGEPLRELSDWLGGYRQFWEGSFQRLDTLLEELQAPKPKAGKGKRE
jgi:DNA-binding transcriptional ArsR family regulator